MKVVDRYFGLPFSFHQSAKAATVIFMSCMKGPITINLCLCLFCLQASSGSSFCNCLVPSPICSPRSQSHPTSPLATQSYPPSLPITAPTKENQINSKEIEDHSKDNEDNDRNPDVDEACDTLLPPEDKNSNETSGGFSNYNMLDAKLSPTSANGEIGGDQTARQWLLNKRLNHNHHHHHHHHNQNQDQQPRRLPTAYLKDLRVHR